MLRSAARKMGLARVVRALRKKRKNDNYNAMLHLARPRSASTRYLSIATMFKDEAPYLAEWLEFHHLVGVEHVYLYDNGSTDSPCKVLEPYIREGFVTVIPWTFPYTAHEAHMVQRLAFVHAILNFGSRWRWMAFIDIDEFLFPVEGNSLPGTLSDYESLPAVAAYWTIYGFNGHETRPSGLTIENYTKRAPYGVRPFPKSIVDPCKVIGITSVHMFDFAEGRTIAYDERKRLVRLRGELGPSNILRLNHYFTRSREEFAAKVARYGQMGGTRSIARKLAEGSYFNIDRDNPSFYDDTILRFVPEVKQRLQARRP